MKQPPQLLTVSDLTRRIKRTLETGFSSLSVQGEISNFKWHTSGHLYFTLRDEYAQISAVMWRSRAADLQFVPEDGMRVVVSGRLNIYEIRGIYQVEVYGMRPLGLGELQLAFEQLKNKLAAEGLFNPDRKRPLPEYPSAIGLVTSHEGAALQDIIHVLRRRFPPVEVVLNPVRVQGTGAAAEIAEAIRDLNSYGNVDVVIVARGGGSLEDLWAFNEESVARAIASSEIPVVTGVGHEIDFTIADFVADVRAPTPSAAAELVVPDRRAVLDIVHNYWYTMHEFLHNMLNSQRNRVQHLLNSYSFNKPLELLRRENQRVDELQRTLSRSVSHCLQLAQTRVHTAEHRLAALRPQSVLKRGYAIVSKGDHLVGSKSELVPDDRITILFHDGKVRSTVTDTQS